MYGLHVDVNLFIYQSSRKDISATIGCIAMKFGTDTHVPLMDHNNAGHRKWFRAVTWVTTHTRHKSIAQHKLRNSFNCKLKYSDCTFLLKTAVSPPCLSYFYMNPLRQPSIFEEVKMFTLGPFLCIFLVPFTRLNALISRMEWSIIHLV